MAPRPGLAMSKHRLETAAVAAALLVCSAFVLSFLFGLRAGPRVTLANPPVPSAQQDAPLRSAGRVEVLNASGRSGLARAATDQLRTAGFDVVLFGNAGSSPSDSSFVIDRVGHDAVARAAARQLGIGPVHTRVDTTLFIDATIIIGGDWRTAEPEPLERPADTWRSRASRWLRPGG
jgi:hypothetical protein